MDSTQALAFANSLLGRSIGGWTIHGVVDHGKSAVVMRGARGGIEAAVKVFHPELVERFGQEVQLERIQRESSLVGAEHPNLVQIFGGGQCEQTGFLFVVMELLSYPNLRKVLADVPKESIAKVISQVASAARFLEDRGLAHRDIKPENILFDASSTRAILLDLGVMRPIGASNITDNDQRFFIATLRYSPPEYLLRKEADTLDGWRAVTFYQLGAVLHDLIMKRQIFDEYNEPYATLVEAVRTVVPRISSDLTRYVTLANHCLIKDPLTRLELVTWSDFAEGDSTDAATALAARERIRQRQKYFKAADLSHLLPSSELKRLSRQALIDVCNRFESRVAVLLNDLGCFPLRTTHSFKDAEAKSFKVVLVFESDEAVGLPFRLSILFKVALLDENKGDPIFAASSAAFISENAPDIESLQPTKRFFSGEAQALLDSQALEAVLLGTIEKAYEAKDRGISPPVSGIVLL